MAESFPIAAPAASAAGMLPQDRTNSLVGDTQDRFLTLLVTQLKNQDPLNPMDNAEVTSQIAQLSTVNGIQQLNDTLLALSGQMDMSQSLQAAGLIGKDILFPGAKVSVGEGGAATAFGVDLMSGAAHSTVTIRDSTGKAVRALSLDALDAGVYPLAWDGKDAAGAVVPQGAYSVSVEASDAAGRPVSAEALTYGHVGSVGYTTAGLKLNLATGDRISLLDIRQVM